MWPRARHASVALAAIYCAAQAVLPLRFLAYGGNVLWHEQGMRFSWRVMVREKNGSVTFHVRDKTTGRSWEVSPRTYLTRLQEREISAQPDLILQLSHRIRDDFEFGQAIPLLATPNVHRGLKLLKRKTIVQLGHHLLDEPVREAQLD